MSDLDRAKAALLKAAVVRLQARMRWKRARSTTTRHDAWRAWWDSDAALDKAATAYARAAREEGEK